MAGHAAKHPYHLVNPSPWPAVGAVSALLLTTGLIRLMHQHSYWLFIVGVAITYSLTKPQTVGASRHALTVGFLAMMVFSVGQRVLPAFSGMRLLFSPRLMFASLAVLNVGCLLRVASEIPAYEADWPPAWNPNSS